VAPPSDYNLTATDTATDTDTASDTAVTPTVYQIYFLNVLGFVAQIPNILLSGVNVFCQVKGYEVVCSLIL